MTAPSLVGIVAVMSTLKELRERAHYSKAEIADELGVAHELVARWENGVVPLPATRRALAKFFNVDPNDIWPVEPAKEKAT